jgi:trehalose/maltose hydrolase-like predicted phosphorylase
VDRHTKAWAELWNTGDIQIEGDLDAQQQVDLHCIICIHLFVLKRDKYSTMGLSSQGYGHIFGILSYGCIQRS